MILLDVKRYIRTHKRVSKDQLQNRFDLSSEAVEGILTPLLEQGFIHKIEPSQSDETGCSKGGCNTGCSTAADVEYFWTERKTTALNISIHVDANKTR